MLHETASHLHSAQVQKTYNKPADEARHQCDTHAPSMRGLPRRRLRTVATTSLVTLALSAIPFGTSVTHPASFRPHSARLIFQLSLALSSPLSLLAAVLAYFALRASSDERCVGPPLRIARMAAALATLSLCFVTVAQAVLVWLTSQVEILWLLCLVVLGLAVLVVLTASMFATFLHAVSISSDLSLDTNNESHSTPPSMYIHTTSSPKEATILQIDKDNTSPQNIVATIPRQDSELVF